MSPQQASTPHGWHLKREIQLGHIVLTLTVAASAVLYISKIEQRLALLEHQSQTQRERDERQDKAVAEALHLIRAQLERIDGKLDALAERARR